MEMLKKIIYNKWFFPSLLLYYGIFYILFGEWYTKTVSTDGFVFYNIMIYWEKQKHFDTYYVYRILPVFIFRTVYNLFSINTSVENVFVGFQIFNLLSIITSSIFLKKIFGLFKISEEKQVLGMFIFLTNFALLKFPFYLSVMTDSFAIMLSVLLLYFYLKNNTLLIATTTLLLAFTWPMGFYQGLLFIALPVKFQSLSPLNELQKKLISGGAILYVLITIVIYVYIQQQEINIQQVAKIDRTLLHLSIAGALIAYLFFSKIFYNQNLLNIKSFFEKLDYKRIALAVFVFVIVTSIVKMLNPSPEPTYTTEQMLRDPFMHALIKPLIFIVADITYFGIAIFLLLFFWNSFAKVVSQLGWGIVAAIALNLFLFGITPQSRHLSNLFPWVIVFLMKAIDKYNFSKLFYITVAIAGILISKIWLVLNNFEAYPPMQLDKNGCMGMPHQKFWMHIGPWMNEQMYFIQGSIFLLIGVVLFTLLYKIEKSTKGNWTILPKYK
ncbi:MAG: hypothetical protein WBM13_02495 [Bacteroidia bacterium]